MKLKEVIEFRLQLIEAISRLLPQLNSSAPIPNEQCLREIIESDVTRLLTAEVDGRIIGMATLVVHRIPTKKKAWIEDVVVEDKFRGSGVGEALSRKALELARELNVTTVELTSNPSRESANRLYRRLGFKPCDTIPYSYNL